METQEASKPASDCESAETACASRLQSWRNKRTMAFFSAIAAGCSLALILLTYLPAFLLQVGGGDFVFWAIFLVLAAAAAMPRGEGTRPSAARWVGIVLFAVGGAGVIASCDTMNSMLVFSPMYFGVVAGGAVALLSTPLIMLEFLLNYLMATALLLAAIYLGRGERGPLWSHGWKSFACMLGVVLVSAVLTGLWMNAVSEVCRSPALKGAREPLTFFVGTFLLIMAWSFAVERKWIRLRGIAFARPVGRPSAVVVVLLALVALAGLGVVVFLPEKQPNYFNRFLWNVPSIGSMLLAGGSMSIEGMRAAVLNELATSLWGFVQTILAFLAAGLAAYAAAARAGRKPAAPGLARRLGLVALTALFCAMCCEGLNLTLFRAANVFVGDEAYQLGVAVLNCIAAPVALAAVAAASARLAQAAGGPSGPQGDLAVPVAADQGQGRGQDGVAPPRPPAPSANQDDSLPANPAGEAGS